MTADIAKDMTLVDNVLPAGCFAALKFLIMIDLYAGAVAIIYGAYTYDPPQELRGHEEGIIGVMRE